MDLQTKHHIERIRRLADRERPQSPLYAQTTSARRTGMAAAHIRKAYCLVDAGSSNTIVGTLDTDGSAADAWDSQTVYDKGDWVSHNGIVWSSIVDANQGNEPGIDEGWVDIQVTIYCELIGASALADCFPTLTVGTMMPVWYDHRDDKWRSLWWFQAFEECPGVLV